MCGVWGVRESVLAEKVGGQWGGGGEGGGEGEGGWAVGGGGGRG